MDGVAATVRDVGCRLCILLVENCEFCWLRVEVASDGYLPRVAGGVLDAHLGVMGTATSMAHTRDDGVQVIPLGCLGPNQGRC
jgi:hypothetical protein